MTLRLFTFDNFDDNSFDTARWNVQTPTAGGHSEVGGRLLTPNAASAAPNIVRSHRNWYDLSKGRLAVQMSRSGTTDGNVYAYFGVRDWDSRTFTVFARSSDASIQVAANSAGAGAAVQSETTIGMGPSLPANTWLSWLYNPTTRVMQLSKSTSATGTWTEIWKFTFTATPTFKYQQTGIVLGATSYGTVTNWTPSWDNVTYIVDHTDLRNRVRFNGALVAATPKVRVDGAWKYAIPRVRKVEDGISDWQRGR